MLIVVPDISLHFELTLLTRCYRVGGSCRSCFRSFVQRSLRGPRSSGGENSDSDGRASGGSSRTRRSPGSQKCPRFSGVVGITEIAISMHQQLATHPPTRMVSSCGDDEVLQKNGSASPRVKRSLAVQRFGTLHSRYFRGPR